jgi:hypothetical protein
MTSDRSVTSSGAMRIAPLLPYHPVCVRTPSAATRLLAPGRSG